jgi:hypothetical protein
MPTLLQKKASKLVEGSRTMGEVLIKAGYSPNTAIKPSQVTKSKGWIELMDKYLPDDEILEVHKKALHATKIHGSLTEPDREVEDIPTQLKAVELGYKVKRKLSEVNVNQQFNFGKILEDERKEFGI